MANPGILPPASEKIGPIPPLENGDQLTREEFERRYQAMPHVKKAELIEGEVYMPSPVRWHHHASPHAALITWLGLYGAHTPGTSIGDNGSIRLDMENEPQPDGALIILPEYGGHTVLDADDYVVGSPELLGEIAASSASIDLTKKLRAYRRNQVGEYIVWRVLDAAIDWFVLRDSHYERLPLDPAGYYQSSTFGGLCLDPAALLRGDMATVLEVLRQGLAAPAHAEFVAKLKKQFSPKS
jgi:hypothetical protein